MKPSAFGITLQPRTYQGLLRGVDAITSAIRPTLGPTPRLTMVAPSMPGRPPELLDDGGLIARRIIQLPDRDEDIGAMYLRHLLWRVREECGDGTVTTAVLFNEIVHAGARHIAQGGHAMPLRAHLEKGARLALSEIDRLTRPASAPEVIERIAASVCYDPEAARMLNEIFSVIGEHGHFEIRTSQGREMRREFVEGSYWESALHSRLMENNPGDKRALLEDVGVLVTDFLIEDPHHLVKLVVEAKKAGKTSLALICDSINEACVGFLVSASTRNVLPVIAVRTPAHRADEQMAAMEDIAILTGATLLTRHAGQTLESLTAGHFGQARSFWANQQFFGLQGGQGDPRAVRRHFQQLNRLYENQEPGEARALTQSRIGKLSGGAAIFFTGGATETEINVRKGLAERAAAAIRGAMHKGIVPGAGMAFLACKPALKAALEQASDPDEAAAYRILYHAMDAPLRAIAANASVSPEEVFAELKFSPPGCGFDALKRRVVPAEDLRVVDSAEVTRTAAYRAITAAALLLTVDVLVRHKKPETVVDT